MYFKVDVDKRTIKGRLHSSCTLGLTWDDRAACVPCERFPGGTIPLKCMEFGCKQVKALRELRRRNEGVELWPLRDRKAWSLIYDTRFEVENVIMMWATAKAADLHRDVVRGCKPGSEKEWIDLKAFVGTLLFQEDDP